METKRPRTNARSNDEAVKAKTGKAWAEWFRTLDAAGAKNMKHQEIWDVLNKKHKVGEWWSQMVAVEYERERGLRDAHQKCTGEYSASGSRTIAAPVTALYRVWADDKLRKKWLGSHDLEISTKTENKSLRGAWDGNKSRLSVNFYPKGPAKCQVAVDHMKLADSKDCEKMKAYWFEALGRLQQMVES